MTENTAVVQVQAASYQAPRFYRFSYRGLSSKQHNAIEKFSEKGQLNLIDTLTTPNIK
ncbi:MAG: hypothetical protein GX348_01650 [Veillonellaceae bacterium]|jgi:hypothetical protein|nr:hypothetical protein [Veillonellaceae bacterium]